jgi:hypothetical protein
LCNRPSKFVIGMEPRHEHRTVGVCHHRRRRSRSASTGFRVLPRASFWAAQTSDIISSHPGATASGAGCSMPTSFPLRTIWKDLPLETSSRMALVSLWSCRAFTTDMPLMCHITCYTSRLLCCFRRLWTTNGFIGGHRPGVHQRTPASRDLREDCPARSVYASKCDSPHRRFGTS